MSGVQKIIDYIYNSINPKDDTEFKTIENFYDDVLDNMKQDGIIIINNVEKIDSKLDWVTIGSKIICRKNNPRQIEWLNEDGTTSFDLSREPIYRRLIPPPRETVDHAFIIFNVILETNGLNKNYLEYGVRRGETLEMMSSIVNTAYGVDMKSYSIVNKNVDFYCMTTDKFSEDILPTINLDYAFIDADHASEQAFIDFENIYKHINVGGYIFLHDTYPCMVEFLVPSACNDCYLTPINIKKKYPSIEMLTLPLNPGLTIIRKV